MLVKKLINNLLWKKLNEAADKFFAEEKTLTKDELTLITDLSNELKKDNCILNEIKNQIKDINKVRKSPEFKNLQKEIKALEKKQLSMMLDKKLEAYQNILNNLKKDLKAFYKKYSLKYFQYL